MHKANHLQQWAHYGHLLCSAAGDRSCGVINIAGRICRVQDIAQKGSLHCCERVLIDKIFHSRGLLTSMPVPCSSWRTLSADAQLAEHLRGFEKACQLAIYLFALKGRKICT